MKKIGTSLMHRRRDPIDAMTLLMEGDPACQSSRYIAAVRRELITILNYVHGQNKGKVYRDDKEDDEITSKDFTTELDALRQRAHIERKQAIASALEVKETICMAIEFLESKNISGVLEKIFQKGGFSKLFSIGKKVEEEYTLSRRKEISKRNSIATVKFKKETVFGLMSGIVEYFSGTRRLRAVNLQELLKEREKIEEHIVFLDFAESLGLTPEICLRAFSAKYSPTLRFFSEVPEIGFLELFIFIRVFCEVFGHQPGGFCSLPKNAFKDFKSLFIHFEKKNKKDMIWGFSPQVSRLRQSVQQCFPKEPKAKECLSQALQGILLSLNADEINQGHASLQAHFPGESGVDFSAKEKKGIVEKDDLSLPIPCFELDLDEVMGMGKEDFQYLIEKFPSLNYWHTFFLDEKDPGKMANFLNRVASLKSKKAAEFARDSMILLFSLEQERMEENEKLQDIMGGLAKKKENNFSSQVFCALGENLRDSIRSNPNNDLTLQESIDNALSDGLDTSLSPLLRSSFWHPSFMPQDRWEKLDDEAPLYDMLKECSTSGYRLSIAYLLKRRFPEHKKDLWAGCYQVAASHQHDGLVRALEEVLPRDLVLHMITQYIASDGSPPLMIDEHQVSIDLPYAFFVGADEEIYYPQLWPGAGFLEKVPNKIKKDLLEYWTLKKSSNLSDDFPGIFDQLFCFLFTKTKNLEEQHIPFLVELLGHGLDEKICILLKKKAVSAQVRRELVRTIPKLRTYLGL